MKIVRIQRVLLLNLIVMLSADITAALEQRVLLELEVLLVVRLNEKIFFLCAHILMILMITVIEELIVEGLVLMRGIDILIHAIGSNGR